jgi:hypothetical protein
MMLMDKEREDTGAENLIYLSYEEIIGLLKKQDPEALKMQTGIREFSYDLRRKGYKKLEIIGHIEPYYGRGWAEVLREEL